MPSWTMKLATAVGVPVLPFALVGAGLTAAAPTTQSSPAVHLSAGISPLDGDLPPLPPTDVEVLTRGFSAIALIGQPPPATVGRALPSGYTAFARALDGQSPGELVQTSCVQGALAPIQCFIEALNPQASYETWVVAESSSGPSAPSTILGPYLALPYLDSLTFTPAWQSLDWVNLLLPVTVTSQTSPGVDSIELTFRWSSPTANGDYSEEYTTRVVQPNTSYSFDLDISQFTFGTSVELSGVRLSGPAGNAGYLIAGPSLGLDRLTCPPGPFPSADPALVCGIPEPATVTNWQYTATAPPAPSITSVTPGPGSATVEWSAIQFLAPYSGFTVTASPGAHTCSLLELDYTEPLPPAMSCTMTGLTAGVTYSLQVRSHTPLGDTAASEPVSVTPGSTNPPGSGQTPPPPPPIPPDPTPVLPPQPAPVPVAGPTPPGAGYLIVDGQPVTARFTADSRAGNLTVKGDDFTLSLQSTPENDERNSIGTDGQLLILPESPVEMTAVGYAPQSELAVYLINPTVTPRQFSRTESVINDIEVLTSVTTDSSGRAASSVVLDANTPPGDYVLQLVGATPSNQVRIINLGVSVIELPAAPSITILGSRTTVANKKAAVVIGQSTGLSGFTVFPRIRLQGQSQYADGIAQRTIAEDGRFRWQRRGGKKISIYFQVKDTTQRSNRIIIQ